MGNLFASFVNSIIFKNDQKPKETPGLIPSEAPWDADPEAFGVQSLRWLWR